MNDRRPAARKKKQIFTKTATGQLRLAPTAVDTVFSARVVSVVLLIATAVAAIDLTTNEMFYIHAPAVVGNARVPSTDVVSASQLEGWHVLWLQPERTEAQIRASLPDLRAAWVWCSLPANCVLEVEERQPAFEWRQGETRMWVDADGVAFPARGQMAGLLIVDAAPNVAGLLPGRNADRDVVMTLLTLAQTLPAIKQYRFTAERGVEFDDPTGRWPVYLGVGQDVSSRVSMWKELTASLASRKVKPKFVDVHLANAPFYGK